MPRSPESFAAERKFVQRLILAGLTVLALGLMFGCAGGRRPIGIKRPLPPIARPSFPIHF